MTPDFCILSHSPIGDRFNLFILNLESEFQKLFSKKALLVMDEEDLKLLTKQLDQCLAQVYNYVRHQNNHRVKRRM